MKPLFVCKIPVLGEYKIVKGDKTRVGTGFKKYVSFNNGYVVAKSDSLDEIKDEINRHAVEKLNDKIEQLEKVKMSVDFSPKDWLNDWEVK